METLARLSGAVVGGAVLIFLLTILRTLIGAIIGFIVGLFFSTPILGVFSQLDMNLSMWQLGTTLGFISGFFQTVQTSKE